ncbi:hypothetical protein [Pseudomonas putida]|uniref:hypothetical protein n=1 Tax=Pseudomonas putida TaxID=303 RepID=UPI003905C5A4
MEQGTLAKGTGVSSLLFGVYTILLALLGLTLAYQGGTLVNAGGTPYYAMMGTVLLLAAALMGLKKAAGIYLYGAASLATYGWAIWESGYNGWAYIPRLAWLVLLSVIFLAFWPLVRRDFAKINKALYFSIMGVLPLLMAATILAPLFFPNTVHLADSPAITAHSQQPFSRSTVASPDATPSAGWSSPVAGCWTRMCARHRQAWFAPTMQSAANKSGPGILAVPIALHLPTQMKPIRSARPPHGRRFPPTTSWGWSTHHW